MIEKIKAWITDHPYLSGAAILVSLGALYMLVNSGSSTATTVGADGISTQDVQMAELAAQESASTAQTQAELSYAQIGAGVTENTNASAVQVAQLETTGQTQQLAGEESMYESIFNNYINSGVKENSDNNNAALASQSSSENYLKSIFEGETSKMTSGWPSAATVAMFVNPSTASVDAQAQGSASIAQEIGSAYENASIVSALASLGGKIAGGLL
jgi:hypothetical protein